jgi:hypothetical protein
MHWQVGQYSNRSIVIRRQRWLANLMILRKLFLYIIQIDTLLEDIRQVHHAYSQLRLTANTSCVQFYPGVVSIHIAMSPGLPQSLTFLRWQTGLFIAQIFIRTLRWLVSPFAFSPSVLLTDASLSTASDQSRGPFILNII